MLWGKITNLVKAHEQTSKKKTNQLQLGFIVCILLENKFFVWYGVVWWSFCGFCIYAHAALEHQRSRYMQSFVFTKDENCVSSSVVATHGKTIFLKT